MAIIEINGLSKRFGDHEAVKNVSLRVEEGEIFGFLGPNGAGKTTTINMMCTLIKPTTGTGTVAGWDIVNDRNKVRKVIGLVFQETTLDDQLTAEQNILFHALAYGVKTDERRARTRELLNLLGLWNRRKDKIRTYSGGMKRRLEMARGLVHHPRVLFLDEQTLGLDPQTRNVIWEYVLSLREKQGLTIFLTTHYMEEAEHSDRIAVIDNGKIIAVGTPDNLKDRVGGDTVIISSDNNELVERELREKFSLAPVKEGNLISVKVQSGERFIPQFLQGVETSIQSLKLTRPTLEDVFLQLTGRQIREEKVDGKDLMGQSVGRRRQK